MDSLPLRYAPAGNDTEGLTLCVKLGVIPGEPKAREGDRVQDEALFPPLAGRDKGWGSQGQISPLR